MNLKMKTMMIQLILGIPYLSEQQAETFAAYLFERFKQILGKKNMKN